MSLIAVPVDILSCIFRYCLLADIMRLEKTNKYLFNLCRNRYLPSGTVIIFLTIYTSSNLISWQYPTSVSNNNVIIIEDSSM